MYIILILRLKVEKYVKKAPVELSIATEGSGELSITRIAQSADNKLIG